MDASDDSRSDFGDRERYEVAQTRSAPDRGQLELGAKLLDSVPPPRSYFAAGGAALLASAVLIVCLALIRPPHEWQAWGYYGVAFLVLVYGVVGLVWALERRRRYVMLLHGLALEVQDRLYGDGPVRGLGGDELRKNLLQYRAALMAAGAVQQASDLNPSSRPGTDGPSLGARS